MRFDLGPIHFHAYSGSNWSDFELSLISNRKADEAARRTTGIRGGFRSDHLLEALGDEDASDTCTVNGRTYHGRVVQGVNGEDHYITALQVASKATLAEQRRLLARQANQLTVLSTSDSDSDETDGAAAAA